MIRGRSPPTRACAWSSARRAAPGGTGRRRGPDAACAGGRRPPPLRHRAAGAGEEALEGFFASRLGLEPFDERFTAAYCGARARAQRPDQGLAARPAARRRRGQHLRRRGAIPRGHPPAAPRRSADARRSATRLRAALLEALLAGIDARGASIDDFRHVDGVRGSFQDRFLVHRRAGVPCPRCGRPIVKRVVAGRGTYVCERCQPRPAGSGGAPAGPAGACSSSRLGPDGRSSRRPLSTAGAFR